MTTTATDMPTTNSYQHFANRQTLFAGVTQCRLLTSKDSNESDYS